VCVRARVCICKVARAREARPAPPDNEEGGGGQGGEPTGVAQEDELYAELRQLLYHLRMKGGRVCSGGCMAASAPSNPRRLNAHRSGASVVDEKADRVVPGGRLRFSYLSADARCYYFVLLGVKREFNLHLKASSECMQSQTP
jgi:hypothetical protein